MRTVRLYGREVTSDASSSDQTDLRTPQGFYGLRSGRHTLSLVSKDSSHAVDVFYKYRGVKLPAEGEVIDVVRFLRGRVIRARVTLVDANSDPQIEATQID